MPLLWYKYLKTERGAKDAPDLSAQEEAEEKGPRFPSEDEDAQRPQRAGPQEAQGQEKAVRVINTL